MKLPVEFLNDTELQLAFHLATGYEGFDYFPEYSCWKAEAPLGTSGLTSLSIIEDRKGNFAPSFYKDISDSSILRELRSENIGLKWDENSNYILYFQALPEITATNKNLAIAFMKVMIKKEFGDVLNNEVIESINLLKTRTKKGSPL